MIEPSGPVWHAAKAERNWLLCAAIPRAPDADGNPRKPKKIGRSADGRSVSWDEAAVHTFDEAQALRGEGLFVGYMPRPGSAMVVLDLDKVVVDDALTPEGEALMTEETYVEVSVSGSGLHALVARAGWPEASTDVGSGVGLIGSASRFVLLTLDWSEVGPRTVGEAPRLQELVLPGLLARLEARQETQRAGEGEEWHWFPRLTQEGRVEATLRALEVLPLDRCSERDSWRDITFALRPWPELLEVWDAWSRLGAGYDAEENAELWEARDRGDGPLYGVGSLLAEAQRLGAGFEDLKRASLAGRTSERGARLAEGLARVAPGTLEPAGTELELVRHNDPARAVIDAQSIEEHLGKRRVLFSVNGRPSYIYRASISIRDPDTGERVTGLAHVFRPVESWGTMCHGHVRYVRPPGVQGRPPTGVLPPMVEAELQARGGALLPPLADIVQHPALLHDGRLLIEHAAHYDEASQLWLDIDPVRGPRLMFDTPEQAVAWIENEWLRDFAFDSRDDCARALTLAGSILTAKTMLGEDAGPPAYVFTAPQASTGKTVLARVMVSAVTGRATPTTTLPIEREEMRKVLFALALQQDVAVVFDNVPRGRVVSDAEACQFSTDPVYKGRVLGRSEMVSVGARMVLTFTGNAINPGGDMIPRAVTVRMRWQGEGSPALRRFDREIVAWTIDHRATILEALRVILTAPLRKGWQSTVGRFPTWSRVVLQPIAQAFGLSAERLVQDWITSTAEDELDEDFDVLVDAMTRVGMQHGKTLAYRKTGVPVFTTSELRDLCAEALSRLDGCTLSETRGMTAKRVAALVGQFVDLKRGGLVLRRLSLNLGERTDRKVRICYGLVPVDFKSEEVPA